MVALYNDQGVWSKVWKNIKLIYNRLPKNLKVFFAILIMAPIELKNIAVPLLKGNFRFILDRYSGNRKDKERGMTRWHDMIDWVGGYPFEVSKPDDVFYFFKKRGFVLRELRTCAGESGCNEYVFVKN